MQTKEETIATLKQFDVGDKFFDVPVLPKAAVLIPLLVKKGELHTLMTLRSSELRTSAGEVCFPGGKRDPSDRDDVDTALREAEEEIGLQPDGVQVICKLFPLISQSGLLMTPVVGFIEETFCPRPNPAEVSAVFTVPLSLFTSEDHGAASAAHRLVGSSYSFWFVDSDTGSQYNIWGLTAVFAMLVSYLALRRKTRFDVNTDSEELLSLFKKKLYKRISKL